MDKGAWSGQAPSLPALGKSLAKNEDNAKARTGGDEEKSLVTLHGFLNLFTAHLRGTIQVKTLSPPPPFFAYDGLR